MKSVAFAALIAAAAAQSLGSTELIQLGLLNHVGGHQALPLLATGQLGQESLTPFLLSQEYGNAHSMLPLMATGLLGADQLTNFLVADQFAYQNGQGHGSMLPMLASGIVAPDQMLPFMMADRFAYQHGAHTSFLPLAATGALGREALLPFMVADEFAYRGGDEMFPMLATGVVTPDAIPRYMAGQHIAQDYGYGHTNFAGLAATGAVGRPEFLPFMAGHEFSHHFSPRHSGYGYPRHHGRNYYGNRRVVRSAPVVQAEASAESN